MCFSKFDNFPVFLVKLHLITFISIATLIYTNLNEHKYENNINCFYHLWLNALSSRAKENMYISRNIYVKHFSYISWYSKVIGLLWRSILNERISGWQVRNHWKQQKLNSRCLTVQICMYLSENSVSKRSLSPF